MTRNDRAWNRSLLVVTSTFALGACAAHSVSTQSAPAPVVLKIEQVTSGPNKGGYQITPDGGNVRIRVNQKRIVRWESAEPFSIEFRKLDNDDGEGGDDFGGLRPANGSMSNSDKEYDLALEPAGKSVEKGTFSAKYTVTIKSNGYEIDPVVIVDR